MTLNKSEQARYSRHLVLTEIGRAGQEKLKAGRVLIVGAGGLGSPAALYLTAAGVGTIGIIDGDRVDVSNLQRQVLFDAAGIGGPKAALARERLLALNPEITVEAHDQDLRAANAREILSGYDLVIDGSDRLGTRYLVNDACVLFGKPLISAAIHRFEGQAMTYVPGRGPCYRCLFSENAEGAAPNCAEAGVLGVLPGVMGTIQATEAIKLITGAGEPLIGRLLTYDALSLSFREFRFGRRPDCAVCGEQPTIREPRDTAELCAADVPGLRQYSAAELRGMLASASGPGLLVIDVRERHEFAAGHLDLAINIPLGELATRIDELRGARTTVFVCLSGVRSLRACATASAAGIATPGHLAGGMRAW